MSKPTAHEGGEKKVVLEQIHEWLDDNHPRAYTAGIALAALAFEVIADVDFTNHHTVRGVVAQGVAIYYGATAAARHLLPETLPPPEPGAREEVVELETYREQRNTAATGS